MPNAFVAIITRQLLFLNFLNSQMEMQLQDALFQVRSFLDFLESLRLLQIEGTQREVHVTLSLYY